MGEPETSLMEIEVVPAKAEEEPVLANLLELYAHDFSEFFDLTIGADGRFGYEPLSLSIGENLIAFRFLLDRIEWQSRRICSGTARLASFICC